MTKRIVLAGGGHAHLKVLESWLQAPSAREQRILIMPTENSAYSGMLPGWMAGQYPQNAVFIPVANLARKAGVQVILESVTGLDGDGSSLVLSNGETLSFDLLSIATGGEVPRSDFDQAASCVLTIRPVENFVQDWAAFSNSAAQIEAPLVAIIGGGAGGVELAFAARARMQHVNPTARVCLITPQQGFLAGHSAKVKELALSALIRRSIEIVWATAKAGEGHLKVGDGTLLHPDTIILATGSKPQPWLAKSGLECTHEGYVRVGPTMQSLSHSHIFAAGDIIERADRQLDRSGVHAVKSGPVLAHNLAAFADGRTLQRYDPRCTTLYLLSTGDRKAIMSWGPIAYSGRSPWWLKEWIDTGFVDRYARLSQ